MGSSLLQEFGVLLQAELGETHKITSQTDGEKLLIYEGKQPVAVVAWSKDAPYTMEFNVVSLAARSNVKILYSLADDTFTTICKRFKRTFHRERNLQYWWLLILQFEPKFSRMYPESVAAYIKKMDAAFPFKDTAGTYCVSNDEALDHMDIIAELTKDWRLQKIRCEAKPILEGGVFKIPSRA